MNYRLITFDVYTALADLGRSLVPPLSRIADAKGATLDPVAFLQTWRAKQMEYALVSNSLDGEHLSFREVTRRALNYTLQRFRLDIRADDRVQLVDSWNDLELWPEAEEVLGEVKSRGYPIGVLSNGDEAMLQALLDGIEVPFDHVFAADQAGKYKPAPEIYELPAKQLDLAAEEVLHVAGSPTDATGAKAAGLTCAWSNRSGDFIMSSSTHQPDFEFQDLTGLLSVL